MTKFQVSYGEKTSEGEKDVSCGNQARLEGELGFEGQIGFV